MSFRLYSIGFAIVIGGLTYAAYLLHVPARWIAVGASHGATNRAIAGKRAKGNIKEKVGKVTDDKSQ